MGPFKDHKTLQKRQKKNAVVLINNYAGHYYNSATPYFFRILTVMYIALKGHVLFSTFLYLLWIDFVNIFGFIQLSIINRNILEHRLKLNMEGERRVKMCRGQGLKKQMGLYNERTANWSYVKGQGRERMVGGRDKDQYLKQVHKTNQAHQTKQYNHKYTIKAQRKHTVCI